MVGKVLSHEVLIEGQVSVRYAYVRCLVMTERQPIWFTLQFSRPQEAWTPYSFSYSDDVDGWIEERAKVRFYHHIL